MAIGGPSLASTVANAASRLASDLSMSSPTKALPTAFPTNAAPPTVAEPTAFTPLWRALTPSTVAPTPASTAPPMAPLDFLGPARMMALNSDRLSSPSLSMSPFEIISSIVLSSMPFL